MALHQTTPKRSSVKHGDGGDDGGADGDDDDDDDDRVFMLEMMHG